ncbi:MAG: hypothetical protein QXF48_02555 [Candidatus Anstonellaceae archaeon]
MELLDKTKISTQNISKLPINELIKVILDNVPKILELLAKQDLNSPLVYDFNKNSFPSSNNLEELNSLIFYIYKLLAINEINLNKLSIGPQEIKIDSTVSLSKFFSHYLFNSNYINQSINKFIEILNNYDYTLNSHKVSLIGSVNIVIKKAQKTENIKQKNNLELDNLIPTKTK